MPPLAWGYKDFMYTGRAFLGYTRLTLRVCFQACLGRRLRLCLVNRFNSTSQKQILRIAQIPTAPIAGNSARRQSN
jgi:hypothetical protein